MYFKFLTYYESKVKDDTVLGYPDRKIGRSGESKLKDVILRITRSRFCTLLSAYVVVDFFARV